MKAFVICKNAQIYNGWNSKNEVQWRNYKIMESFKCVIFWNNAAAYEAITEIVKVNPEVATEVYVKAFEFID